MEEEVLDAVASNGTDWMLVTGDVPSTVAATVRSILTPVERAILSSVMIAVCVLGVAGNAVVIACVALSRKLRCATNVFVVNLAAADLATSLTVPWTVVATLSRTGWPLAAWLCAAAGMLLMVCIGASIYTLACIAAVRCLAVTGPPGRCRGLCTPARLGGALLLVWSVPLAVASVPLVADFGRWGYDAKYSSCTWDTSHPSSEGFSKMVAWVFYPLPLLVIVYSYARIYVHVRRHSRAVAPILLAGTEESARLARDQAGPGDPNADGGSGGAGDTTGSSKRNGNTNNSMRSNDSSNRSKRSSGTNMSYSSKRGSNGNSSKTNTTNNTAGDNTDARDSSSDDGACSNIANTTTTITETTAANSSNNGLINDSDANTTNATAENRKASRDGNNGSTINQRNSSNRNTDTTTITTTTTATSSSNNSNNNTAYASNTGGSAATDARRGSSRRANASNNSVRERLNRRQVEVSKNMFYVVCAFALCISPYGVCLLYDNSDPLVPYAGAALLCGGCVNPFIYATKHPDFKKVIRLVLRGKFSKL